MISGDRNGRDRSLTQPRKGAYRLMSRIVLLSLIILVLLGGTSFAEDPKPKENRKQILQDHEYVYEDLPSGFKRLYEIPEDFLEQPAKENKNLKTSVAESAKESKKAVPAPPEKTVQKAPKMEGPKDRPFLDVLLDTLFGPGKKTSMPVSDLRPDIISMEEEKETAMIEKINLRRAQISGIEQLDAVRPLGTIIENALKKSPDIQKARLDAEIIKRQNTFTPIPTFSIGNDFATGKTIISAGVQLPLEPLFTGRQREKYGDLNIRQKQEEVTQRCVEQYRTVISTAKKLETRLAKKKYIDQLVKNAQEQYKGGLIKLDELIKAQELQWALEIDEQNYSIDLETQIEKLKAIENGGK